MEQPYYIEQYRHKNDPVTKSKFAEAFSLKSLKNHFAASKETNHITICYFIVKPKQQ